jgi:hypothetical protein
MIIHHSRSPIRLSGVTILKLLTPTVVFPSIITVWFRA